MKKDKEWLKEAVGKLNSVVTELEADGMCYMDKAVSMTQVYDLIDELDEPEKVVIPQFVAEWWEHGSVTMYGEVSIDKKSKLQLISNFNDRGLSDHLSKVEDWIDENESTFLDLVNGKAYEIEKESLYYVKLPNTNSISEYLYLAQGNVSGDCWFNSRPERLDYEAGACKHKFTEKEIKAIDERYWNFAVEVPDE